MRQLFNHPYIDAYKTSIEVSLVTAVIGGVAGLFIAYAAIREGTPRWVRSALTTFSGVAANFGGIPLAFAFISTLGPLGIITVFARNHGWDPTQHGLSLFSKTGVELAYLYFQLPLMILVIAPAIDGLRKEWREASSNLGGSQLQFWRYVGIPVLMPSLLGAIILLFGNAFAAYATAYSLTSGHGQPRPDSDRRVLQRQRAQQPAPRTSDGVRDVRRAGADDGHLHPAAAARGEVGEVKLRRRMAPSAYFWLLLGSLYFFVPLIATMLFSLKSNQTGKCCTAANYSWVIHNGDFWHALKVSAILAVETIVISLILFVPTIYWVHLKVPKLRPVIAFLALIPFVVPPIVMVVGLLRVFKGTPDWFYAKPWGFLAAAYVILAFPYMFFSLDAGFRAIDVHTLTEASQNLGARWTTTLLRVILPNIRAAALAGSFLTLAIVMGEFTIANLSAFHTFPIFIQNVQETQGFPAASLTLLSFAITWAAMLSLLLVGRKRGVRGAVIAGAR